YGSWEVLREGHGIAILGVGSMVQEAMTAASALVGKGLYPTVVNCRFLKPYDRDVLEKILESHPVLLTVEEGGVVNGFGAYLGQEIGRIAPERSVRMECMGIPDDFVEHGARKGLLRDLELDAEGIVARVEAIAAETGLASSARVSA
ncbi:MAG: 1-deoxy-D-xylulose-5-phosphate synthase, partial [Gemmatimonadetes bacterium]|nr:1-deoxy-D-xylulose-5-phosphate synthase [Gemmatimonadota bacterium]